LVEVKVKGGLELGCSDLGTLVVVGLLLDIYHHKLVVGRHFLGLGNVFLEKGSAFDGGCFM